MSNFGTETFADHIQNGKLFYGAYTKQNMDVYEAGGAQETFYLVLTGGTTDTYFNIGIITVTTITVILYEGMSTSNDGTEMPMLNLNRGSSTTTTATVHRDPTTPGGTDLIWAGTAPNGDFGTVSPFNSEAGIILKAGEEYLLSVANNGDSPVDVLFSCFTRGL